MKEKDTIEKLIEKNLNGLNNSEPPAGHFDRFEKKLTAQSAKRKSLLKRYLTYAAAVVFIFLLVNQGIIWFSPAGEDKLDAPARNEWNLASVSPEYEEVEFYFTNAINGGLNQWEKMVTQGFVSEEEQQMMTSELAEFEKVYDKLQSDLATSPNDDRVIQAMLEYYQTKLNLINLIVDKLEEVKQKNKSHEAEI